MSENPAAPDFWNQRYAAARMPWDIGGVPAALDRFLATHPGGGAHVLIPGCGSGYEIGAFARAGYAVTALDFSPPAVARARRQAGPDLAPCIAEGDFFTHTFAAAPFDLIYERTFFCALPPPQWPAIVSRMAGLLKPGGRLVGFFFFGDKEDGPPFGLTAEEAAALFDPLFETMLSLPVPPAESLPLYAGREQWQERQRRPGAA